MRRVHAVVPDSVPDQLRPSGGNTYDRRLVEELASLGWPVEEHLVPGVWPPDPASRRALEDVAARLPDGEITIVDGLLASNSPELLVPLAFGDLRKLAFLFLHKRQMRLEQGARETAGQVLDDAPQHRFAARRRHEPYGMKGAHRPTCASTSARRKRSTTNMKAIDGTSRIRAVMEAIW